MSRKTNTIVKSDANVAVAEAPEVLIPGLTRGGKNDDLVWEVNDRISRSRAYRIRTPEGDPTSFAMVYGHDGASNGWTPIRPVSDRYTPLPSAAVVDEAIEALNGDYAGGDNEVVRTDRAGTTHEISLRLNRKIEVGRGKPFDLGHPWSRNLDHVHGREASRDVVIPTFRVRNAYDATSSIVLEIGLYRLICENGAKVLMAGCSIRAIHTLHEVRRVVSEIRESGRLNLDDSKIKALPSIIVPQPVREQIVEALPDKWQKDFVEYAKLGNNSAWAVLNGLSYLQTHEYTLSRGRQLNKLIGMVYNAGNN